MSGAGRGKAMRDVDGERRALSDPTRDRHPSAERLDELLHDAQAQPDPTGAARTARTHLMEGIKDVLAVLGRHARSRIGDLAPQPPGRPARLAGHRPLSLLRDPA